MQGLFAYLSSEPIQLFGLRSNNMNIAVILSSKKDVILNFYVALSNGRIALPLTLGGPRLVAAVWN
jgi:hypothetical protein